MRKGENLFMLQNWPEMQQYLCANLELNTVKLVKQLGRKEKSFLSACYIKEGSLCAGRCSKIWLRHLLLYSVLQFRRREHVATHGIDVKHIGIHFVILDNNQIHK